MSPKWDGGFCDQHTFFLAFLAGYGLAVVLETWLRNPGQIATGSRSQEGKDK